MEIEIFPKYILTSVFRTMIFNCVWTCSFEFERMNQSWHVDHIDEEDGHS